MASSARLALDADASAIHPHDLRDGPLVAQAAAITFLVLLAATATTVWYAIHRLRRRNRVSPPPPSSAPRRSASASAWTSSTRPWPSSTSPGSSSHPRRPLHSPGRGLHRGAVPAAGRPARPLDRAGHRHRRDHAAGLVVHGRADGRHPLLPLLDALHPAPPDGLPAQHL